MADVSSKNMYALLGNDPEEDSDREPEPPTKAKDKPVARTGKRDGPDTAPPKAISAGGDSRGGSRGGRGRGRGGNEGAFNDRGAGRDANRSNADYVNQTDRPYRGGRGDRGGRGRGGRDVRGGRGERIRDDRHSHGRANEHEKQVDQSWGAPTGGAEWDDEKAGEVIAQEDAKEATDADGEAAPVNADGQTLDENSAPAEPAEPEEVQKTWDQHLAEQAEKKLALGGSLDVRKPNEGSKADKKWANAKEISKDGEEDDYIKGGAGKAQRTRERKEKQTLEIDHRFQESSRGSGERGRGRGRGDGYRGDRGGERGRGRGRGDRGDRSGYRGDRGDRNNSYRGNRGDLNVNASDEQAFPKLGA